MSFKNKVYQSIQSILKIGIIYFLLFSYLYGYFGYYFVFKIEQFQQKKELKSKLKKSIPTSELTIFSFNTSSPEFNKIEWVEKSEFKYKGKLYDIVYQTSNGENKSFYCINDKQEEKLFANLEEHVQNFISDNDLGLQKSKKASHKIPKDYFFQHTIFDFPTSYNTILHRSYFHFYSTVIIDIPSPPPCV